MGIRICRFNTLYLYNRMDVRQQNKHYTGSESWQIRSGFTDQKLQVRASTICITSCLQYIVSARLLMLLEEELSRAIR